MGAIDHPQHDTISRIGIGTDADECPAIHDQGGRWKPTHVAVVATHDEIVELDETTMKV